MGAHGFVGHIGGLDRCFGGNGLDFLDYFF
jgi:hypothetical protein